MPDNLGLDNLDYDDPLRWVPTWVMLEQAKLMLAHLADSPTKWPDNAIYAHSVMSAGGRPGRTCRSRPGASCGSPRSCAVGEDEGGKFEERAVGDATGVGEAFEGEPVGERGEGEGDLGGRDALFNARPRGLCLDDALEGPAQGAQALDHPAARVGVSRRIRNELEVQAGPRLLLDDGKELVGQPTPADGWRAFELGDVPRAALIEEREEQVFLGPVAVVERALRQTDTIGDLLHGGRLEAALGEGLGGRRQQRRGPRGVLLCARGGRGRGRSSHTRGYVIRVGMKTETSLRARQKASQRAFYRAMASGSPGAELVELDGIQATIVPIREWFSIFNSAFYDDPAQLEHGYARLAAAYEAAGVKAWTVWVPPDEPGAVAIVESRGHVRDSTPMLFASEIAALDLAPRRALDLDPSPGWELVGQVNDRAYGVLPPWSLAAVFETMDDPASHLHIARDGGEAACALIAREHDGDCYFWFVATAPDARGAGLASELMRHALRDARSRGCTTTTLESTAAAEEMYTRLGYTPLGRYETWERRTA